MKKAQWTMYPEHTRETFRQSFIERLAHKPHSQEYVDRVVAQTLAKMTSEGGARLKFA